MSVLLTLGLLVLSGSAVFSATAPPDAVVEVSLHPPDGYPAPATATLTVVSGATRSEVPVPLPGTWRIAAPARQALTLTARADGLWAQQVVVLPPGNAEIRFVPAGRVRGRLVVPRGSTRPSSLRLYFASPTAGSIVGDELCPIDEASAFSCVVPAGSFDLHLRADNFVSHFFWGKPIVAPGNTDLGTILLVAGNSLTGWLRTEDARPLDATCTITIHPSTPEISVEARRRLRLNVLQLTHRPDGRGFFHFAGVAAGVYDLVAQQKGYADAMRHGLVVQSGFEARVVDDVILARPRTATIEIIPARSPDGTQWLVSLVRVNRNAASEAGDKLADEDGVATFAGCVPGRYVAQASAGGKRWAAQFFELGDRDERVSLDIGLLHVVGRVLLGKQPLGGAALIFGGRTGEVSIEMLSDGAGAFDGFLPHGGDWRVDISSTKPSVERSLKRVTVARRPGRDYAQVELRLPDSRLQGTVTDEAGNPVERAIVRVQPRVLDEGEIIADASGGAFDVRGIAAGVVEVQAEARDALSDPVIVSVAPEGVTGPLELIVRKLREVKGQIIGPRGPVPGARVYLRPLGEAFLGGDEKHTDAQGAFTARLSRSVSEVAVEMMAPGYAMGLLRVRIPESSQLSLSLSEARGAVKLRLPRGLEESLFAVHAGASSWAGAVMGWAQMNPAERHFDKERNELTVPALEVGVWQFCVAMPGSAEWVTIWAWGLPLPQFCVEHVISPGAATSVDLTQLGGTEPHE